MITQMKKYTFLVFHREYEAFLEQLREVGVVHITEKAAGMADDAHLQELLAKAEQTRKLIAQAAPDQLLTEKANIESRIVLTKKEADRMANDEAMRLELEALRREKTLSNYKASYLSQGYDERLADEAATALADGDMDTVFALMKKHSMNTEKSLRAKILKEIPVPPAGENPSTDMEKQKELEILRASFGLPPLK